MSPSQAGSAAAAEALPLSEALRVSAGDDGWDGVVHPGWDIYGIPHGGYLMALSVNAALAATGAPDVFTVTTHYLAKATLGPIRFRVRELGGGRRFRSHLVEATQADRTVLASVLSVGDRDAISGPRFDQRSAPDLTGRLGPRAGDPDEPSPTPELARSLGIRIDQDTHGFAVGEPTGDPVIRALVDPVVPTPTDQLLALVACDATPPAAWNALGVSGWVPTVGLTAQVRARPCPGPLSVVTAARSVSDGLLEEDAEVYDAEGHLVVLSRQLARWTETPT
jgi:hypothetical protein